ncbi:hypothetical protein [Cognatitamlana onchidii]|uniref:hypothetical protein n=1 Tax=Cognatitamlana onchidii TaxID=2562860 RepID=UPI0010A5CA58|nr:hypothetical protein [Algibacter onchidii]
MKNYNNLFKVLAFFSSVVLVLSCDNYRIINDDKQLTSIAESFSAFKGNYTRLIAKVTKNRDSSYIELLGGKYQKVTLIPVKDKPNTYKIPNGRIVFSLGKDSQQIGLIHYRNKKESYKVFAQKINALETNTDIQGEYIYQGCKIVEENNRLYRLSASGDKLEKRELFPISPTEFIVLNTDEKIEFVMGVDGKATKVISLTSKGSTTFHTAQHVMNNSSKIGTKYFNGGWTGGGDLAMFWSHDPTVVNNLITRCIISFHGGGRNAVGSYEYVQDLSIALGVNNSTMVLAPHFCQTNDGQPDNVLYWTNEEDGDWRKGDNAANLGQVSSFEIIDRLIESAVNNCPNLLNVVLVGHSAGGQIVTRYSTGTQIPEKLSLNTIEKPSIRFIVSNPSSYMYFSNKRWSGGIWPDGSFTTKKTECSEYNPSHYEAIHLNDYMSRDGVDLISNVKNRHVIYLLGDQDTKDDLGLDKTCQAMLQGKNRFERGFIFLDHLREEFGAKNVSGHSISIVPDVGHNTWLMYRSYNGLKAIFDYKYSLFRIDKSR